MERETFEIGTFHNYGTRGQRGRQILRVFINMERGGRGDQQVFRVSIDMERGSGGKPLNLHVSWLRNMVGSSFMPARICSRFA